MTKDKTHTVTTGQLRRWPLLILGMGILIAAIAISYHWVNRLEPGKPKIPKKIIPSVEIQPVSLSLNQAKLSAGGFVTAKFSSNLAAEVSGTVLSVSDHFAVGKTVRKGQVLATVDNRNHVAALATAKSNLATAKSNHAQEQAQSEQAGRDAKKFTTKASDLTLRKPQLAATKAAVENTEAQLLLAKINLDKTKIKAPFEALIQARNIAPADSITAGTVVAQLVSTEVFTVKLTLSGDNVDLLALGNQVELHDANSNQTYHAQVNRFDPSLNNSTRTAAVYVDIKHPLQNRQPLLLNAYLTATIIGKNIADSMWVDNRSIVKNEFVWIKRKDDTLDKSSLDLLYRGKQQSLVQFNEPISGFVSRPKDDFFVGKKVRSEASPPQTHNQSSTQAQTPNNQG